MHIVIIPMQRGGLLDDSRVSASFLLVVAHSDLHFYEEVEFVKSRLEIARFSRVNFVIRLMNNEKRRRGCYLWIFTASCCVIASAAQDVNKQTRTALAHPLINFLKSFGCCFQP